MSRGTQRSRIETVGCVGVGKSTLLRNCTFDSTKYQTVFEDMSVFRSALDYYSNFPSARAFYLQTTYYLESHLLLHSRSKTPRVTLVSDFSLDFHHYGYSLALSRLGQLDGHEVKLLSRLLSNLSLTLPKLSGIIYCYGDTPKIAQRIQHRSREGDIIVDTTFLNNLQDLALKYVERSGLPTISVDSEEELTHNCVKVNDFVKDL